MSSSPITRRSVIAAGIAAGATAALPSTAAVPDDEMIRVAPDHFGFETARTHRRFVPFGSNLVMVEGDGLELDIFGPHYSRAHYERVLGACEEAGINVLKVYLRIHAMLPDPQVPGEARIAGPYLDNLDDFLGVCTRHHIRAIITLAEWGGHTLKWWSEGGGYFGRRPWRTDPGIDSLDVLARFWTRLGTRLRGNPAVFAYTPCVEWSIPNGNLTPPWAPAPGEAGLMQGDTALWYWRAYLQARYRRIDALNRAWGAAHAAFDAIPRIDYTFDEKAHRYVAGDRAVLDYQNYREWVTMRYFRPQLKAVRAADPEHMITISNHERCWNLWAGAAQHFLGYTPAEEKALVDYVTYHDNRDEAELAHGRTMDQIVRELQVMARFSYAGRPTPVIVEEFTFGSDDPRRTAEGQAAMVRGSVGHASGWMTWYLQYPNAPRASDGAHPSAWFEKDLTRTAWGEQARALRAELDRTDTRRKPAARTIRLDRATELVPKVTGVLAREMARPAAEGPTDYIVTHERDLDLRLEGDR